MKKTPLHKTPWTTFLIDWRDRLGLTQKEAADALGVPLRTYTRWELGERSPRPEGAVRLALAAIENNIKPTGPTAD